MRSALWSQNEFIYISLSPEKCDFFERLIHAFSTHKLFSVIIHILCGFISQGRQYILVVEYQRRALGDLCFISSFRTERFERVGTTLYL